jgi:hypothetical protein
VAVLDVEVGDAPSAPDGGTGSSRPSRGRLWAGRSIVLAAVAVATAVVLIADVGLSTANLGSQWQVVDLRVLSDVPLHGVWYMHTQPPAFNLIIGLVAWSSLPLAGTMFAINVAAILGTGLLLHGLLVRWGVGPVTAGVIAAISLLNPCLLSALHWGHYEVLVAFTIVAALVCAHRFLEDPQPGRLLLVAALITLSGLLRSLFHPVWVIAAIALLIAVRRVPRRYAVAALGIPAVLFGAWMVKNMVLFDTATTSSWVGFNLQRGVVASMDEDDVAQDVADGTVSSLALEYPWGIIEQYEPWIESCEPNVHPALLWPEKEANAGVRVANFNHECYLPLYRQAQEDAVRLIREHPGRYLSTRGYGLLMAYQPAQTGLPPDETWIDRIYRPALLVVQVPIPQDDWNLPLLGTDEIDLDVSLTLLALSLFVTGRGGVAGVRLARAGWAQRHEWPAHELTWALVAATFAFVVVGGSLIEFGENGRFRSSFDPLLIALPLGWGAVVAPRWWRQRKPSPADPIRPGG